MDDITVRLRRGFGGLVHPICDEAANEIEHLRMLNASFIRATAEHCARIAIDKCPWNTPHVGELIADEIRRKYELTAPPP